MEAAANLEIFKICGSFLSRKPSSQILTKIIFRRYNNNDIICAGFHLEG